MCIEIAIVVIWIRLMIVSIIVVMMTGVSIRLVFGTILFVMAVIIISR
jgi:hypothetical protein